MHYMICEEADGKEWLYINREKRCPVKPYEPDRQTELHAKSLKIPYGRVAQLTGAIFVYHNPPPEPGVPDFYEFYEAVLS